jgi:hypothetical protein
MRLRWPIVRRLVRKPLWFKILGRISVQVKAPDPKNAPAPNVRPNRQSHKILVAISLASLEAPAIRHTCRSNDP